MFTTLKARLIGGAVACALAFAAGVGADRCAPFVGASAQLARLGKDRDAWRKSAGNYLKAAQAWERSFRGSEHARASEHRAAVDAVNAAQLACDGRVAAARRSALAIHTLVTKEVPHDAQGCPVRQLVPAGELFDALGAARPSG